ncbi:hypothetical protein M405DRAFT_98595 [Rhizopogon salebrosus TDB-379]|nr:hypothetical protein M405DRAFT_98595 [Rhizopogon salebrosus TDB-379]
MDAHSLAMSPYYPNVHIRVYTTQYLDPRRPEWLRNPFSGSSRSRNDELMKLQECCLAVVDVSSAHANFCALPLTPITCYLLYDSPCTALLLARGDCHLYQVFHYLFRDDIQDIASSARG